MLQAIARDMWESFITLVARAINGRWGLFIGVWAALAVLLFVVALGIEWLSSQSLIESFFCPRDTGKTFFKCIQESTKN